MPTWKYLLNKCIKSYFQTRNENFIDKEMFCLKKKKKKRYIQRSKQIYKLQSYFEK